MTARRGRRAPVITIVGRKGEKRNTPGNLAGVGINRPHCSKPNARLDTPFQRTRMLGIRSSGTTQALGLVGQRVELEGQHGVRRHGGRRVGRIEQAAGRQELDVVRGLDEGRPAVHEIAVGRDAHDAEDAEAGHLDPLAAGQVVAHGRAESRQHLDDVFFLELRLGRDAPGMVIGRSLGFSLSLTAGLFLSAGLPGGAAGSAKASPATTAVSIPAAAHPCSLRMASLSVRWTTTRNPGSAAAVDHFSESGGPRESVPRNGAEGGKNPDNVLMRRVV